MSPVTDTPTTARFSAVRRKTVKVAPSDLVQETLMMPERSSLLMIEPKVASMDLAEWAREAKPKLAELLLKHRAILFRNFAVDTPEKFHECVSATSTGPMLEYVDRTTPRPAVGEKLYVSTVYPSEETINMHCEGTYWITWPLKIYFCSLKSAEQGGETPIADVRKVLERISPETRRKFDEKGVMYLRNYNDGFGLTWQETFQTSDRTEVENYCREHRIEWEWKGDHKLRTRQMRPAIRRHPITGESVWFNHGAFFHVSSLDASVREALLNNFGEENLPYNTYYGDGSKIEEAAAREVQEAYDAEKIIFPWKDGDVLLLDNMTMAHGRQPYKGSRKVIVAMVEPYSDPNNIR
jgi:alpha-ketoglutarate-dependent taurine dioxygenase